MTNEASEAVTHAAWAIAVVTAIALIFTQSRGCYAVSAAESQAEETQRQETARACVTSQRPAMDCALILRGTGR